LEKGTHKDLLALKKQQDPWEEFKKKMDQRFASKFKSIVGYFAVSSHNMSGVRELLRAIAKLCRTPTCAFFFLVWSVV
jgi:hypothetical protein